MEDKHADESRLKNHNRSNNNGFFERENLTRTKTVVIAAMIINKIRS